MGEGYPQVIPRLLPCHRSVQRPPAAAAGRPQGDRPCRRSGSGCDLGRCPTPTALRCGVLPPVMFLVVSCSPNKTRSKRVLY